jgi:hypothetical protein
MRAPAELDLDTIARRFLEQTGRPEPADARVLAVCYGLRLVPLRHSSSRTGAALLRRDRLYYNAHAKHAEQQRAIAECIARLALKSAGAPVTPSSVGYVARRIVRS